MAEGTTKRVWITITGRQKTIAVISLFLYYGITLLAPVVGDFYLRSAAKAFNRGETQKAGNYFVISNLLGHWVPGFHHAFASAMAGVHYSEVDKNTNTNTNTLRLIERKYERALALNDLDGDLYIEIASFYYRTGRKERAKDYLLRVTNLFPYDQKYKFELARFHKIEGRYGEARKILTEIVKVIGKSGKFDYFRVQVLRELAENCKSLGDLASYDEYTGQADKMVLSTAYDL